jgi:hypothetical protein
MTGQHAILTINGKQILIKEWLADPQVDSFNPSSHGEWLYPPALMQREQWFNLGITCRDWRGEIPETGTLFGPLSARLRRRPGIVRIQQAQLTDFMARESRAIRDSRADSIWESEFTAQSVGLFTIEEE